MKNIVLLGGSNSVMVNGLQKGLREYANVTNLALGATTSIQNLYELYRPRNQEAIQNADLIVTESNINDIDQHAATNCALPLNIIFKNLQYFYQTLYSLNKPICIIIFPFYFKNHQIINNMHRFLANYFGLNIIDIQNYYAINQLIDFGSKFNHHQLFEELIQRSKQQISVAKPTPPVPKPTPQPTPQELEIKSLKEALSKKEKDINNLELNYQKALNTKNHLSYKLGQALIKANKNWYKGGYIKFIFEVMRIKKEHRKRGQI